MAYSQRSTQAPLTETIFPHQNNGPRTSTCQHKVPATTDHGQALPESERFYLSQQIRAIKIQDFLDKSKTPPSVLPFSSVATSSFEICQICKLQVLNQVYSTIEIVRNKIRVMALHRQHVDEDVAFRYMVNVLQCLYFETEFDAWQLDIGELAGDGLKRYLEDRLVEFQHIYNF
ncbi:uncharacterized protein BDZ99DRAFT_528516 [Mytilinidion resinicola]|uniref:Uncharacterized protein n=1 Tax=Mytilinidion resinicola TaxID=574789 RepID=A0A6A6XYQ6_9PEZI|nr:uncharacterized protein BDZ99DRAFT_528516 [Mytilinidion resinicola]KAF2801408.1 hypothetical protein BDZ99DRAFT_528516 [Mytilinidion resinicola]